MEMRAIKEKEEKKQDEKEKEVEKRRGPGSLTSTGRTPGSGGWLLKC